MLFRERAALGALILAVLGANDVAFAQAAAPNQASASTTAPSSAASAPSSTDAGPAAGQPAPSDQDSAPSSAAPSEVAPPASQAAGEDDGPGFGIYFDLDAAMTFSPGEANDWAANCPSVDSGVPGVAWNPQCTGSSPLGVLSDARLGLRFDYIGVEAFGLFAGDWSKMDFSESIPGLEGSARVDIGRVGGGLGGGVRLMSSPGLFRISAGAGGGVIFRHVYSTVSSLEGANTGYQAPIFLADVNITLLHFLNIGVITMLEFSKDVAVNPDFGAIGGQVGEAFDDAIGPITVFQGTQFFIGPRVGLHIGG